MNIIAHILFVKTVSVTSVRKTCYLYNELTPFTYFVGTREITLQARCLIIEKEFIGN